jgi:hypothetical protein
VGNCKPIYACMMYECSPKVVEKLIMTDRWNPNLTKVLWNFLWTLITLFNVVVANKVVNRFITNLNFGHWV